MNNIFSRLGHSFPTEDFFTATVGLFVERNPAFRDAFLAWLEEASGESLRTRAWQVEIQSGSPSCAGDAVLDMKLRHPDLELWFEHKVGAPLGKYRSTKGRDIDQLEKYLDAAARVMNGIGMATDEVDWPTDGPVAGQPRVMLFYISRSGTLPQVERYAGKTHRPSEFGLVWPSSGPLRWRDFWPRAQVALEPVLNGEGGEFERTLTRQFVTYWQSLIGMWMHADAGSDWRDLLARKPGERCAFEPLLDGICAVTSRLEWPSTGGFMGNTLYFAIPTGPVDQVTVGVYSGRDQIPVDSQGLPDEIIEMQFRLRNETTRLPSPGQRLAFERWRGVTGLGKSKKRRFLRIYVGVADWQGAITQDQRTRAVTGAFIASLEMFRQMTGVILPGMDRL